MAISCSACGKAIESSTRFCTSCGAPVSERAQSKGNRQEDQPESAALMEELLHGMHAPNIGGR